MSGFICPTCDSLELVCKGKKFKCKVCDWCGVEGPRKSMSSEMWRAFSEDTQRRLKLRKSGRLLRVVFDPKYEDDTVYELMDMLNLDSMEGGEFTFIEFKRKPSSVLLKKIKALKGVKKVIF